MTAGFDDGQDETPEPASPRVFTRVIITPPALPWEQVRAAGLDARMNTPVASPDIVEQVRRLEGWRPGAPGRFVAAYVRGGDIGEGLTSQCRVEGRMVTVTFASAARRQARMRQMVIVSAAAAATVVALGGGVAAAVAGRLSGEAALAQAEDLAGRSARLASQQQVLQAQDRALVSVGGEARGVDAVARDLAWVSRNRGPGAAVEAFHWRPDYFAVEARGGGAPFQTATDRQIKRASRPVRTGVWLWGVAPEGLSDQPGVLP